MASAMSAFHLDLGERDGELIAVDGFRVASVRSIASWVRSRV
jgi:hypothetical protein